jgi:hypothetical protein
MTPEAHESLGVKAKMPTLPYLNEKLDNIEAYSNRFERFSESVFVCFGFNVTSTQYRSYRDVPALLVEEDLRCPSMNYFRHEREPE